VNNTRLSYLDRIKKILPSLKDNNNEGGSEGSSGSSSNAPEDDTTGFFSLLPPKPQPNFRFRPGQPGANVADEVMKQMRARQTPEELSRWFRLLGGEVEAETEAEVAVSSSSSEQESSSSSSSSSSSETKSDASGESAAPVAAPVVAPAAEVVPLPTIPVPNELFLTKEARLDLLVQCLLYVGSKSFTHICKILERYIQILSS
jgi:hypothetical protein